MTRAGFGFLAGAFLIGTTAEARWETVEEASAVDLTQSGTYLINGDGTYDLTYERTLEIRRDSARTSYGTISFSYGSAATKLVSITAETINGGTVTKVAKEQIEDKAERGDDLGFDKINKVSVAFPEVNVGSKLHYKYTLHTHTVPVPGMFSSGMGFGSDLPELPPATITYRSKVPLEAKVDDPQGFLAVTHKKDGAFDVVSVTLKRPVYFKVVNEKDAGWFPHRFPSPSISVSTSTEWKDIGAKLAPAYEAELSKPLPEKFARLADAAKAKSPDFIDRANDFTSALADAVRYMGDWRTVKGGHVPRPSAVIAQTAFGDCKDMALITAASLRRMGYKANMALVHRGESPPYDHPLPTMGAFNHAIVWAKDEKGVVHWVDPTNRVSRAQGIRVDIAGRPSLIVDGGASRLETTPALRPLDTTYTRKLQYDFRPETEEVIAHHAAHFGGAAAEGLTGLQLMATKGELDEALLRELSDGNEVITSEIGPYDLKSRVVRDLDITVSFKSRWSVVETSAGYSYSTSPVLDTLRKLDLTDRVSGYPLGAPDAIETTDVLVSADLVGDAVKPCQFSTKWLDGERKIEITDHQIAISHRYEIKEYGISNEDLRSDSFKTLQQGLKHCLGPYAVIFHKDPEANASEPMSH